MIPTLVFDLETIPDAEGLRRLNPQWSDLGDTALIEAALEARRESHGNDFLPLHLQKIAVVGCVFRDDQGFRVKTLGRPEDPEDVLIAGFFKTIGHYTPTLVSWNGSGFDLPVLHYRSLIHGVAAPRYWDTGEDDREFKFNNYLNRYHNRHVDLMDVLAKFNGRANAPLDQLAKLCGFPGKLGMDGGQVWQAWHEGRRDEVRAYCETDVVNTWLVYCRYRLIKGDLDATAYQAELELVRDALRESGADHWREYLSAWDHA